MLNVNEVICSAPKARAILEGTFRIVGISPTVTALVPLHTPTRRAPQYEDTQTLWTQVQTGCINRLEVFELPLPPSLECLPSVERIRIARIMETIAPLLGDDLLVIDPDYRARALRRVAREQGRSEWVLRRYLNTYWWGGMIDRAFARTYKTPDEHAFQVRGTARRGRKPKAPEAAHIILPDVWERLQKGVKKFYVPGKFSVDEAYHETLNAYFSIGKRVLPGPGTPEFQSVLPPENQLPSFRSFRYACEVLRKTRNWIRKASKDARRRHRRSVQRGTARAGVAGPGYRYEIDSTRLQIRIVSRYNRRHLLQEATLYIVIDVWSGAIVGYALSLENASWALAAQALRNCFTDKGEVFKRLKLPYVSADWPSAHLPSRLAADRAEFVSNKAGSVPGLGLKVEIMPSMCPDRKGTIEGRFNPIKHGNRYYKTPGSHVKNPGRREKDGKAEAAFTLFELDQQIVEIILDLNNDPAPPERIPPEILSEENPAVSYIGLFTWGLKHRAGFTRTLSPREVFSSLMLPGTGKMHANGIHFKTQTFNCEAMHELGLPEKAARRGSFEIEIRYDEHFADQIWFYSTKEKAWVPAFNMNEEVARLAVSFWEAEDYLSELNQIRKKTKGGNIDKKRNKAPRLNHTAKNAMAEAKAARAGLSKTQSKSDIRLHTEANRLAERMIQARDTASSLSLALPNHLDRSTRSRGKAETESDVAIATDVADQSLALWRSRG